MKDKLIEDTCLTDVLKSGKKVMLRCEVVEDYAGNCHVKVKVPTGEVISVHLNDLLSHDLMPYTSWEEGN